MSVSFEKLKHKQINYALRLYVNISASAGGKVCEALPGGRGVGGPPPGGRADFSPAGGGEIFTLGCVGGHFGKQIWSNFCKKHPAGPAG